MSSGLNSYEEELGRSRGGTRLGLRIDRSGPVRDKDKARIIAQTLEQEDGLADDGYGSLQREASRKDSERQERRRRRPRGKEAEEQKQGEKRSKLREGDEHGQDNVKPQKRTQGKMSESDSAMGRLLAVCCCVQ